MTYQKLKGAISIPATIAVTVALFIIGGFAQALSSNASADAVVAQKVSAQEATATAMNDRLGRIESKLDLLIQGGRGTGTATK